MIFIQLVVLKAIFISNITSLKVPRLSRGEYFTDRVVSITSLTASIADYFIWKLECLGKSAPFAEMWLTIFL